MEETGCAAQFRVAANADPFSLILGREGNESVPAVGARRDALALQFAPISVPVLVDFKDERHFLRGTFRSVELEERVADVVTGEEIRIGGDVGVRRVVEPRRAAPKRRTKGIDFRRFDKPKVRVAPTGALNASLERARIQKFVLRRIVASKDDATVPIRKVADHLQIRRTRANSARLPRSEIAREAPELTVHRRKIILRVADLANTRPLRIPAVRAVVAVRRFRKTIRRPLPFVKNVEENGANVPAKRPQRFLTRLPPVNSVRSGRLGELRTTNDLPTLIGALPRPLRQASGRSRGIFSRGLRILAVVRVDKTTLRHVPALAVITGKDVLRRRLRTAVSVFADNARFESIDVDFVQSFFHRHEVDFMLRTDPRTRYGGHASRHVFRLNRPHVPLRVDRMKTDKKLVRFAMNHSIGVRSPYALGTNRPMERRVDLIQFIGRAVGEVRAVRNHPQAIRPRNDCARPTFPFVIVIR